jgi:hypothetical protein
MAFGLVANCLVAIGLGREAQLHGWRTASVSERWPTTA